MQPGTKGFMIGILAGAFAGLLIGGLLIGVLGYAAVKKKEADVRRGWNLTPVVVATQDLPEGTTVTFDMIAQRSVPEQFVTSSVVRPEAASYIVNQAVLVPIQAGDMLLWSQFEIAKASAKKRAGTSTP